MSSSLRLLGATGLVKLTRSSPESSGGSAGRTKDGPHDRAEEVSDAAEQILEELGLDGGSQQQGQQQCGGEQPHLVSLELNLRLGF